jgi:glycolate oxidase
MPRSNVERAEKFTEKVVYPAVSEGTNVGAYLLTTFDCRREEEMEETMEAAAEVMLEGGALDVLVFDNANAMKAAWDMRRAVPEAILETYDKVEECDIVVPISYIAEIVEYAQSLADEVGLDINTYGHAGDGNIHVNLLRNEMSESDWKEKMPKAVEQIFAKTISLGGNITGEHGVGLVQKNYLPMGIKSVEMDLMKQIKRVFDPLGILNPGKIFPDDVAANGGAPEA